MSPSTTLSSSDPHPILTHLRHSFKNLTLLVLCCAVLHNYKYRCFPMEDYEKRALGEKYKDKQNWREYNEKLVARGEAYISLDFIETQDKDLEKL